MKIIKIVNVASLSLYNWYSGRRCQHWFRKGLKQVCLQRDRRAFDNHKWCHSCRFVLQTLCYQVTIGTVLVFMNMIIWHCGRQIIYFVVFCVITLTCTTSDIVCPSMKLSNSTALLLFVYMFFSLGFNF